LIKKELLKKVSRLCLQNASQLLKDADLLFAFKSYGSALALVTIGNEEFGKAVIYKMFAEGFIDDQSLPINFHECLKKGNFQELASQSCWMGLALASCLEEFGESIYSIFANAENINLELTGKPSSNETKNIIALIDNLGKHIIKFQNYYQNKNDGLHVFLDYVDEKANSPLEIDKSEVNKIITKSRERFSFVEPFFEINLSKTQKQKFTEILNKAYVKYHFLNNVNNY
jgi:hypothetical protein